MTTVLERVEYLRDELVVIPGVLVVWVALPGVLVLTRVLEIEEG